MRTINLSFSFAVINGNHYSNLSSLPEEARIAADAILARWLDLPVTVAKGQYILRPQASNKMQHNTLKVTKHNQ